MIRVPIKVISHYYDESHGKRVNRLQVAYWRKLLGRNYKMVHGSNSNDFSYPAKEPIMILQWRIRRANNRAQPSIAIPRSGN